MPRRKHIHVAAILGSLRRGSRTRHVLDVVLNRLRQRKHLSIDVIDPSTMTLAFPGEPGAPVFAEELITRVTPADALVLATPEYHGSYSSVIKIIIDNLGYPSAMANKPTVLVGVASGRIGAVKALEHLRSVCAHVGCIVLPNPVSVARVNDVLTEQGLCTVPEVQDLLENAADYLVDYLNGLGPQERSLEEVVRERRF